MYVIRVSPNLHMPRYLFLLTRLEYWPNGGRPLVHATIDSIKGNEQCVSLMNPSDFSRSLLLFLSESILDFVDDVAATTCLGKTYIKEKFVGIHQVLPHLPIIDGKS